jgi:hypothetical protein
MRITIAAAALIASALMAGATFVGPEAAHATPDEAKQAHPLYDDGGTLDWRTKWAEAAELAKARRGLVFVEWGRES